MKNKCDRTVESDHTNAEIMHQMPSMQTVQIDPTFFVNKMVKNSINIYPSQAGFMAVPSFWVVVLYRSYCPLAAASRVRANRAVTRA